MTATQKQIDQDHTPGAPVTVVLLSGGLDSAVTLAHAVAAGFECHTLAFDYGQRHRVELEASARLSPGLGARSHRVFPLNLRAFGGSALTDDIAVPKNASATRIDPAPASAAEGDEIPVTYVPARNLTFLSIALGLGEVLGARHLHIGVNALDYSGYPDCRPGFIRSFEQTANLATKMGVSGTANDRSNGPIRVHTPLIELTKAEIIRMGSELGVDFSATHSCYDPEPEGLACGRCDSCVLRRRGFLDAGVPDTTRYAEGAHA